MVKIFEYRSRFREAKFLYDKLKSLEDSKSKLVNAKNIEDIDIIITTHNRNNEYIKFSIEYLDFDNFKSFLLEEINREIAETQKKFDEL